MCKKPIESRYDRVVYDLRNPPVMLMALSLDDLRVSTKIREAAADEIERLRAVLHGIEIMTATGEGLDPTATIEVHILAAEGRSYDPHAWRADPDVIANLRKALIAHKT